MLSLKPPSVAVAYDSAEQIRLGAIPQAVFGFLDRADLVIADVSHSSPNTYYEIAYLHALGTPVIYLDYLKSRKIEFYLQNQLVHKVQDFTIPAIRSELLPLIDHAIENRRLPSEADNLITQYFGVPMIDASAVSGVALGYVHNFVRHVLHDTLGVLIVNDPVDSFVILRPSAFDDAARDMRRLEAHVGTQQGVILDAPTHPAKKLRFTVNGSKIVDFPTPVASLSMSPRFQRALASMQTPASGGVSDVTRAFETKMIDGFFTALRHLVRTYPGLDHNGVRIMTLDELLQDADGDDPATAEA